MDWNAAIERNRTALKRVLAALVAMAALPVSCTGGARPTLPRRLHRAVLRLLRPAEAAARRLVIIAARGIVVSLPPARPRKPQPNPSVLRDRRGTGILMPPGIVGLPPLKGKAAAYEDTPAPDPSPLRAGVRGGGRGASARPPALRLLDPLRRLPAPARPVARGVPRISIPGAGAPFPVAIRRPPSPFDPVDATRLALRLAALASALDDLPGEARRFARWRARRGAGRVRRPRPLRPGRPPGWRRRPTHEVHDILNVVHGLAFWALEAPDTS